MPSVFSSCISSVDYDEESEDMTVYFVRGGVYVYSGVPKDVYEEFINAGSIGSYFYYNIRDVYG
jgi:hypothetical protein